MKMIDKFALEMGLTIRYKNINILTWSRDKWFDELRQGRFSATLTTYYDRDTYNVSAIPIISSFPFASAPLSGLVKKTKMPTNLFAWVSPFSSSLWIAVLGGTVALAVAMHSLASLDPDNEAEPASWILTLYHSFAILVGGEDYEFLSGPLKLVRLGVLTFVLILVSTYTANLASFFTKPAWSIHGPKDMQDLMTSKACIDWSIDVPKVKPFVGSVPYAPYPDQPCTAADVADPLSPCTAVGAVSYTMRKTRCLKLIDEGRVDVYLTYEAVVQEFVLNNCAEYSKVDTIRLAGFDIGVAMIDNSASRKLMMQINDVATTLMRDPWYYNVLKEEWGVGKTCGATENDDLQPVTLHSMVGLFLVPLSCTVVAFSYALWLQCDVKQLEYESKEHEDAVPDSNASTGEMLQWLIKAETLRRQREGGGMNDEEPMTNGVGALQVEMDPSTMGQSGSRP